MANILCISSQVVVGHVGNSASAFALERLGHESFQLPTVLLSNHPGHAISERISISAQELASLLTALRDNGMLKGVDAVFSGYLPTADHVELVAGTVDELRQSKPDMLFLCDPAFGDDPKGAFLPAEVVAAISKQLVPLATALTPNAFELAQLTQRAASTSTSGLLQSMHGTDAIVVVTSVEAQDGTSSNVVCDGTGQTIIAFDKQPASPKGTGDLFAGLLFGHLLNGRDAKSATHEATRALSAVIAASAGHDELQLSVAQAAFPAADTTN